MMPVSDIAREENGRLKEGTVIPIRVGGRVINTTIDHLGTQRLPSDPILCAWVSGSANVSGSGRLVGFTLNDMVMLYHEGKFTFDEWLDFYLNIGYSVGGFCDLSEFSHLDIVNPVWGDDPADVLTGRKDATDLVDNPYVGQAVVESAKSPYPVGTVALSGNGTHIANNAWVYLGGEEWACFVAFDGRLRTIPYTTDVVSDANAVIVA